MTCEVAISLCPVPSSLIRCAVCWMNSVMSSGNGHVSIRVRFYGPLRAFVVSTDQRLDVAGGTLVRQLISALGVPEDQLVYTMCLINERRVPLDSPVAEGDVLDVFQPVAGG